MRIPVLALLLGLPIALSGCDPSTTQPFPSGWQATVTGEDEFREMHGTLGAASQFGTTVAHIALTGPADTTFTWRLARGSCTTPGTGVGPVANYPDLTTSNGGNVEGVAELNLMLDPDASYVVLIHTTDGSPAACGELERQIFSRVVPRDATRGGEGAGIPA